MLRPPPLLVVVLLLLTRFAGAEEPSVGKSTLGESGYIEYVRGDLPLILTSPHGGRETPEDFPDRTKGVLQTDTNTQEFARAIAAEIHSRTGHHAHLVICRLARKKLDCNREIVEAAAGFVPGEQAWNEYHSFIEKASAAIVAQSGKGFLIDVHGQGHKDQRIELGYLHPIETYALSDAELNAQAIAAAGSLRLIAAKTKTPYADLVRGPNSLGALLEAQGYPAAPSPRCPTPVLPFFIGGYTVARHAGKSSAIAGMQMEANFKGVRDTAEARTKYARAFVPVLFDFLSTEFALKLDAVATSAR
jgi:hypothetical protein